MKVAYFGSDLFTRCLAVFAAHGHRIDAIFLAGEAQDHAALKAYAEAEQIEYFEHAPDAQQIAMLEARGVNCFFSNQYDALIPAPSTARISANVHPTMLPHGRGATPLNHLILRYPQHAGVTLHKLSERFDEGDIMLQAPLPLDDDETLESLIVKLDFRIPALVDEWLGDLNHFVQQARPQQGGDAWPRISLQDRLIDWRSNCRQLQQQLRAFGRFGVIACAEDECWRVNHLEVHATPLPIEAGAILREDDKTRSIALSDGYVIIYKDSILERMPTEAVSSKPL